MKHIGTQTIETPRLILRRLTAEDARAAFDNWMSDPEVTKYLTWPTYVDVENSRKILTEWEESYAQDNFYQWGIVPKDLGEPIGSISAVNLKDAAEKVEIGYCIGSRWWHQGIMSEAMKAVMDFFFDEVGAGRVEARHDPLNPHSGNVMKKCGMIYEGTLRQADRNNQGICDMVVYALLASEREKTAEKP